LNNGQPYAPEQHVAFQRPHLPQADRILRGRIPAQAPPAAARTGCRGRAHRPRTADSRPTQPSPRRSSSGSQCRPRHGGGWRTCMDQQVGRRGAIDRVQRLYRSYRDQKWNGTGWGIAVAHGDHDRAAPPFTPAPSCTSSCRPRSPVAGGTPKFWSLTTSGRARATTRRASPNMPARILNAPAKVRLPFACLLVANTPW